MNTVRAITAERLSSYGPDLDSGIVDAVAREAEVAASYRSGPDALVQALKISSKVVTYSDYAPLVLVDLPTDRARDEHTATIVRLPMACGFGPDTFHRLARMALMLPDERIIAVANPSAPTDTLSRLSSRHLWEVAHGHLMPLLAPLFNYLGSEGVEMSNYVGVSWGAESATGAAALAASHGVHQVLKLVGVEPPGGKHRGIIDLALTFLSTRKGVNEHIAQQTDNTFRGLVAEGVNVPRYISTLAHPTNLGIAMAITRGHLEQNLRTILDYAPNAETTIAIGKQSELAPDCLIRPLVERLRKAYSGARLAMLSLQGNNARHSMYYDLELMLAITLQGLRIGVPATSDISLQADSNPAVV